MISHSNKNLRECSKCGFFKESHLFRSSKTTKDKISWQCRDCDKIQSNTNKLKHKEKYSKKAKEYRESHKEQIKQLRRNNYLKNREKEISYAKKRNEEKREDIKQYERERFHFNPKIKVSVCISSHIYKALKQNKAGRKWEDCVGYTLEDLMNHLERLFKPGMTWENYGLHGWHVDHILPKSSFTYSSTDDEEFKKCWALNNLQPLWAEENWSKSDKI